MPDEYWAELLGSVVAARNFVEKVGKKVSPVEMITGRRPCIDQLRVFGALAWTRVQDKVRQKLDANSKKGIVMLCMSHGKYRIYIPEGDTIVVSQHVVVDESGYPARNWQNGRTGTYPVRTFWSSIERLRMMAQKIWRKVKR